MSGSLYCKDISINLILAIRLCDAGCTFEGDSTNIVFSHPNGDKLHVCRTSKSNELWTVRPIPSLTCLSVSTDVMHHRLGHLHSAALRRFCKGGGKSPTLCTSCVLAKSHRHPFQSSMPQADRILYRIHSDVVGPFQTPTPSGNRYFVSFINECSRYARIYLLKRKDEVLNAFRRFLSEAERHTGNSLCILKCDRGGEYSSSQFRAFTASHGIKMEQGPANTPEHNSVAERYNRTVMECCRAQMIHAGMPNFLWGEFVMATSHILNLSPTRSAPDIPADAWQKACAGTGAHLSDLSFLRVLGCQALVHVPKTQRRKLDPCARDLILVGYETGSKSYRLWDPNSRKIVVSLDFTFNESNFPLRESLKQATHTDDDDEELDDQPPPIDSPQHPPHHTPYPDNTTDPTDPPASHPAPAHTHPSRAT